jgi:hypothetical protein
MYTNKFYVRQDCYQIIVTNNAYIMCGFIFSFKLNAMPFLLIFNENEFTLNHLYTQLKVLIILF